MKAIKKVQVTPLDYNFGKIIDSASTTDDKTKNTYSMRVIDDTYYTKNESDAKYQSKGDFAVLTNTIEVPPVTGSSFGYTIDELDYPQGFNKNNSIIISNMIDTHQNGEYCQGYTLGAVATDTTTYASNFVTSNVQPRVVLRENFIEILVVNGNKTSSVTYDYKIVLMKIDAEVSPSV